MKKYSLFVCKSVLTILLISIPLSVKAFPIAIPGTEGLQVFVNSTDDIITTYQGNSASFSNDLFLDSLSGPTFIFNNHSSAIGSTVNLGSFEIGTELHFRIHVNNTGTDFFTGPASRNPDNHIHARVQENWKPNETLVSFEDLFNGPFHYNDLSFSFTNVVTTEPTPPSSVPAPTSIVLVTIGLLSLFTLRRKQDV